MRIGVIGAGFTGLAAAYERMGVNFDGKDESGNTTYYEVLPLDNE